MRAKLRQVGNSIGLTIPASDLRAIDAEAGDTVEIEIKRVIKSLRETWDDPARWRGASDEPPLPKEEQETEFERADWEW
jgi:antitoxin component of MazEF toxin-antitoxin module